MKSFFIIIFLFAIHVCYGQTDSFPGNKKDSGFFSSVNLPFNKTFLSVNAVLRIDNSIMGSHYLFDKWVEGSLITSNSVEIANKAYYFNYDKISNNLFLTTDFKEIIEIDKREFKSFVLKDGSREYFFEHVPVVDDKKFFQVLVKDKKYSLYKLIVTKFKKNESFNNSGGFVDSYSYYVIFPGEKLFKKINLSKKSIIKNIFTEPEKVDEYLSSHQYDAIDEALLIDLINYLNK